MAVIEKKVPDLKRARRLAKTAEGVVDFYTKYGISRTMFYNWLKRYPDFEAVAKTINKAGFKRGKPPWDPPLSQIEDLAAAGLTKKQICSVLHITIGTYMKYQRENPALKEVFKRGRLSGVGKVKNVLYESALQGNLCAVQAFLKRYDKDDSEIPAGLKISITYEDVKTED